MWPSKVKSIGNLLDMWDGMANDTKDFIRETETGFYNAVEAFRPPERINGFANDDTSNDLDDYSISRDPTPYKCFNKKARKDSETLGDEEVSYNGDTFDNLEHAITRLTNVNVMRECMKVRARKSVKVMWRTKGKAKYRIGIHTKRDVIVSTLSMMERG